MQEPHRKGVANHPDLEALAILIADPALNRRRERLPGAFQAEQAKNPHPKTIRRYLEDILKALPTVER
jgi:hypothetical protein